MYTGPIRREPQWPDKLISGFNDVACSRIEYLEKKDINRRHDAEWRRCQLRRRKPGFEVLDNMRYGG